MTLKTPRRVPVQERSRATVEAILQATAQILVERGYRGTNTNDVAERAGVSIGTLYQYFSNKNELIDEVTQRQLDRFSAAFLRASERRAPDVETWARRVITYGLGAFEPDLRILQALAESRRAAFHERVRASLESLQEPTLLRLRDFEDQLPEEAELRARLRFAMTVGQGLSSRSAVLTGMPSVPQHLTGMLLSILKGSLGFPATLGGSLSDSLPPPLRS